MEIPKVGGEVEAYCMTCKTMKWHVVVAVVGDKPAKVECHGCHKQHVFRAGPPGAPKPKAPRRPRADSPSAPAPIDDLEQRLSAGESAALVYSPKDVYAVDQIVRHPSFGVGLVVALPAAQKVEVAFRSGRKLLVHQRGEAVAPTLVRPARRDDDEPRGVTDAPDRSRSGS
jgi:hypothetical protein